VPAKPPPLFPDVSKLPTRGRILETARRLIHYQGYEATGIAQILEEADVKSGSFYFFFESKEALLLELLRTYREMLWPEVMQPAFNATTDPVERVFAVLGGYRMMLLLADFKLGCPIGNLALEVSDSVKGARKLINENLEAWKKVITSWLEEACARFARGTDLADLAAFVLSVMEGGILTARARKHIEPYDRSIAALREHVARLMKSPKKGKQHA
jgi:TetR/AcrR family transcriptional regulator, transcriptional repressor for nem operon